MTFPEENLMFIIIVLAAFCCCLCLCAAQATRLLFRDTAECLVTALALDTEQPNTRGPPSPAKRVPNLSVTRCPPRLCRQRRKQRRGYSPRRKPCASTAQGFRPAHECARTIPPSAVGALRASFPENDTTVPAGSAGSLFRRNRPASGMSSSLHSSTARMK